MSRFPVLDFDRETDEYHSNCREVLDSGFVEPADDSNDGNWITLPIRSVITQGGPSFEIGPYSLTESDIIALHLAVTKHMVGFPEIFRLRNVPVDSL